MSEEQIYIRLSTEMRNLIRKERIDLERGIVDRLQEEGVSFSTRWDRNPTSADSDREVVLVIVAGAAAVSLVGTAIAKVIDAVSRGRHTLIKERELIVATDSQGNAVRDRYGNPVYNVKERPGLPPQGEANRARMRVGTLLELDLAAGDAAES